MTFIRGRMTPLLIMADNLFGGGEERLARKENGWMTSRRFVSTGAILICV